MPSEISRMLPGRPLWPYGIFAGSTSMVLPLGRNVTLNFFVAGVYLTSSMYGLLPPIFRLPPYDCQQFESCRTAARCAPQMSDLGQVLALQRGCNCAVHQ